LNHFTQETTVTEFSSTTVDDSGDVHGQVTLAIGSAGAPVIAYTSQSGEVRLAEQNDQSEWIITKPPCGTASRDEYRISLDIDSQFEPHIALANASTDHLVYGARGQQWTFEEVPTEGGILIGRVRFPSMKLYKGFAELPNQPGFKDAPHICYQAAQGLIELRHAAKLRPRDNDRASPVWRKHVSTIDGAESGWFSVLDIDTDDTILIAHFTDLSNIGGDQRLNVTSMIPADEIPDRPRALGVEGFRTGTLDGGAGRGIKGAFPSLAQTIAGGGAVSYMNVSTPQSLNLSIFANELPQPVVEVVTRNVDVGGSRSSVARSLRGRWCVAYGFNGRLMFATRTGPGAFTIEDVEVGGGWPSMRFKDDGGAQIAHVAGGTLQFVVATPDD
jgi:hypothetical protein